MSNISIQFHALPEELATIVDEMVRTLHPRVVCLTSNPFSATEVEPAQVNAAISAGRCSMFAFLEREPMLDVRSQKDFGERNPGGLYLEVGRETEKGLAESWLRARISDGPMPKSWTKFAAKLRAATKAGATAVSPDDGATSFLRNHRFTAGAKDKSDQGVPILPAAGVAVLKLGG